MGIPGHLQLGSAIGVIFPVYVILLTLTAGFGPYLNTPSAFIFSTSRNLLSANCHAAVRYAQHGSLRSPLELHGEQSRNC